MRRQLPLTLSGDGWCFSRAISLTILTSTVFNILLLTHTLTDAEFVRQSCPGRGDPTNSSISSAYITGSTIKPTRTIAPRDMKALEIDVAFLTNVGNNGLGKHFGGAFFLAIEELNKDAAAKGIPVHFNWTFKDTGNLEAYAMRQMSDLYCKQSISAFIGPDAYCKSAGLMATAFNIPYITFHCHENHNDTAVHMMVNTQPFIVYISRFIVSVLQNFNWKSFWLIRGQSLGWQSTAKQLIAIAATKNISLNGETDHEDIDKYAPYDNNQNPYRSIIQATRHRTRVYVFLGDNESLRLFLRELKSLGIMDSGEYAVVAADDDKLDYTKKTFYMTPLEVRRGVTEKDKREKLSVYQNVLMVSSLGEVVNQEDFEKKVYERNTQDPINLSKPPEGLLIGNPSIPPEAYQLYDATMFYGRAVMALMSMEGADPKNASQIINYLRCRHHDSIQGNKVWIHSNGESEGSYFVQSLDFKKGVMQRSGSFPSSDELVYKQENPVTWISGHPPISDPKCGFDGTLCPSNELDGWIIAIIAIAPVVVILLVVVVALYLRRCMYEKKLDRLVWKIERDEIQLLNAGQFRELMSPARPRKKDSYSGNQLRTFLLSAHESDPDIMGDGNYESEAIPVGVYKGTNVVMKQLTRKQIELTRALKKQMQLRKELTHENINRFIGACIETPHVYIVTQYCPRKSLQDILEDDDSPLDDMFITSLVQDLIRGMCFIHESEFGYHGNLKSSNCLVDSRWTLKITDFGLSALGPPPHTMFEDEESFRELSWTAPELLRYRRTRSTSSNSQQHHSYYNHHPFHYHGSLHNNNNNNNNNQILGSQKGDVYSFAIILYELYGRAGPWGNVKMTYREIIERLIIQTSPMFRPDTTSLTCDSNIVSLIQACWDEDSDLRPDFKYSIRSRFKPIQQGFLKSNIFDNMLAMMEKYANNLEVVVAERTEQLKQEKKMTENLLLRMLPRSVAEKLKRGQQVEPEQFEQVSIYFSDIVGFTEMSADSTPMEVVDLLNNLYTCFDSIIGQFDVYKVETIGDAYMVVSGLPIRNGDRHAGEIASMSLLLLEEIKQKRFMMRGNADMLKIRIGIHSGPCCAGVVGLKMPRYCLFGDTVNTANRLESTGQALKIHCSAECKKILDKLGGYNLEERGYTEMKGKGSLLTYFLLSEDHLHRYKRISSYEKSGEDGRCVSSSNLDYSGKLYSLSSGKTNPHVGQGVGKNHGYMRDSLRSVDRNSWASIHNTSIDSTWSEVPDDTALQFQHEAQQAPSSPLSPPTSPHQFISSTLPRANGPRHNNAYMSPIAEDPGGVGETSPLEKTVSFPNTCILESNATETDSLLEGNLGKPCIQLKHIPQRRSLSSRSVLMNGPKTGGWGLGSKGGGRENKCVVSCQVDMVDGSSPETVL